MTNPKLTLHRADRRYYVSIEETRVGWVLKSDDGWTFYATIRESLKGEALARGEKTRRDALLEGIGNLRIRHLGRIYTLNTETWKDDVVYLEEADLKALEARLLDEKYPLATATKENN